MSLDVNVHTTSLGVMGGCDDDILKESVIEVFHSTTSIESVTRDTRGGTK